MCSTKMVQNDQDKHFGQNHLVPNRTSALKWTNMSRNGPCWSFGLSLKVVYFVGFLSANHTVATPNEPCKTEDAIRPSSILHHPREARSAAIREQQLIPASNRTPQQQPTQASSSLKQHLAARILKRLAGRYASSSFSKRSLMGPGRPRPQRSLCLTRINFADGLEASVLRYAEVTLVHSRIPVEERARSQ